jgi:hypothetical protein
MLTCAEIILLEPKASARRFDKAMSRIGAEGWELVAHTPKTGLCDEEFYFKREIGADGEPL